MGRTSPVLSVATQQSWKDANEEWQSRTEWHRVVAFNRLGESIADALHKGDHVLVDSMVVSTKYERENGKSKKAKTAKVTVFSSVRANSVCRFDDDLVVRHSCQFEELSQHQKRIAEDTPPLQERSRAKIPRRFRSCNPG
jgi:single stranded DNA-binding protein